MGEKKIVLFHVTTVPETFGFFRGQIAFMKERGFEVHAVSFPGVLLDETGVRESIQVHPVVMHRQISPLADLRALYNLCRLFRSYKPAIVHAHTPKGGLLGVLAARLTRVPIVIYGMRGLPFVTAHGLKKTLLCLSEIISCRLSDLVLAVSHAIRKLALSLRFCPKTKIIVLGQGSSNGVDAEGLYNPGRLPAGTREKMRGDLQIPTDSITLGYVGRIVRDKGIVELEEAWQGLRNRFPKLHLLLSGPIEPQDPVPSQVLARLHVDPRVRFTGWVNYMPAIYESLDILILPTYREGFPNTPLEAAAMELPVVATQVDGCAESVLDGVTGLLVPPQDSRALAEAIERLLLNPVLRKIMGQAGRQRALKDFKPEVLWELLYKQYLDLLNQRQML